MSALPRGKPRPKAYLSIGEYLRKAGAFKTVNVYYNDIVSTHPSVALSDNGDDEEVDELAEGMIEAAQHGHLETLRFLANKAQTGGEEGGLGTCIGERVACLMLHLAAEFGHEAIVHYLVEDLWVDVDEATTRGMTALHYAAKANRTAVVRELARLGADLEAKNDAGQVPAQLTKDRLLRRLFQQYLGGNAWGGAGPLVDRFVSPSASRVVDYVAVMTVKLAPQLMVEEDKMSRIKHASVSEIYRFPEEDHEDTPMTDASNLAEICTQNCVGEGVLQSGPLPSYGTLLTDPSGARSYVWSKVIGVYQDAAQRGRARVHTALGPPAETSSVTAGEMSVRIVLVLARHPYTSAYASICDHVGELILEEAPKWGSLAEWPLNMDHERNSNIRHSMESYAVGLPLPLPSQQAKHEVLGRALLYGDPHASHSSFPHMEESDVFCLTSRLGPDTILAVLSCLLQEQSVLLLSDRVEDLAPATCALLGLLFPLRWPHTLIPVLPASLLHYLEAPVPFLMGMHQGELGRVGADLSCITIVYLTTNKVVLPIRPITSVSTVVAVDSTGKEPQRRMSRRDSGSRSLAELPRALKSRAENRLRRCVPLESFPPSDRAIPQPRASTLYTPGIRVALADVMVDLFGAYQTYRYVAGAQKRMVSEAPEDHRKLLETVFSTQLWRIFLDDLLAEEAGANGECWEEQAQLFCACVERARHQGGAAAGAAGESQSCQDILYPSEDVEEQLSLLSVYPEPDVTPEGDCGNGEGAQGATEFPCGGSGSGGGDGGGGGSSTPEGRARRRTGSTGNNPVDVTGSGGGGRQAEELSLQEKTDEVLRSITTSFATVTDMFGRPKDPPPPPSPVTGKKGGGSGGGLVMVSERDSSGVHGRGGGDGGGGGGRDGTGGGGGWDLFKPPSMADMKRRLEEIKVGSIGLPPPREEGQAQAQPSTATAREVPGRTSEGRAGGWGRGGGGSGGGERDSSESPPLRTPPKKHNQHAAGGGLALFGESWRDIRRRSAEAVNEAVTKLKTALDDSDDDGDLIGSAATGGAARSSGSGIRAAASNPRSARDEDDAFWKPFGNGDGDDGSGDGGGIGVGGSASPDGEPVPLPTAGELRKKRAADDERVEAQRASTAAKAALDSYYGGGSGGGGAGGGRSGR